MNDYMFVEIVKQKTENLHFIVEHNIHAELNNDKNYSAYIITLNQLPLKTSKEIKFIAAVNHYSKYVRFAWNGISAVQIDNIELRNLGLGTYAFTRFIKWLKLNYNEYKIKKLVLSPSDALTEESKNNRNFFYENLGFKLEFEDKELTTGHACVENISKLRESYNKDKIDIIEIKEFVSELFGDNKKLKEEVSRYKNQIDNKTKIHATWSKYCKLIIAILIFTILIMLGALHKYKLI